MNKKTECEIVQDLLLGYVDDVLNTESKKLVEKHLLECKECKKRLNEIQEDIELNKDNQNRQIDYLKKVRRKNIIKSIIIAIGIIFFICFYIYLRKFIIVNNFISKANKLLESKNFYMETTQVIDSDSVAVKKEYYKDGKYKIVTDIYSDSGLVQTTTEYATTDSDERIGIDNENNKVTIKKGEMTKLSNKNLKNVPFVEDFGFFYVAGNAFNHSIYTSHYDKGTEYYVLNKLFDKDNKWEIWIDKETGLPLRLSGNGIIKSFFEGTDIVKEVIDMKSDYKYEFDIITDADVTVPDYTGYEIQYIDTNYPEL